MSESFAKDDGWMELMPNANEELISFLLEDSMNWVEETHLYRIQSLISPILHCFFLHRPVCYACKIVDGCVRNPLGALNSSGIVEHFVCAYDQMNELEWSKSFSDNECCFDDS